MQVQQSIQYALMCLCAFKEGSHSWLSVNDISREQGVPFDACVEVVEKLTHGGLLIEQARRYKLARASEDITAMDVVMAASTPAPKTTRFLPLFGIERFRGIRKTREAVAFALNSGAFPSDSGRTWKSFIAVLLACALAFTATPADAYNFGTRFADIIMEFVQPGKVYNLRTMRSLPYRVSNRSDREVELTVRVEIPRQPKLKPGYEAIPDPSWIKMVPDRFKLAPGEEGLSDVILQVPADERYKGHHYQAHLVCKTADPRIDPDKLELNVGVTLESRLRFSVASAGPAEIRRLQKEGIYKTLNFTLEPDLQYAPGFIEPGKKVALEEKGVSLSLVNRSKQDLTFRIVPVQAPEGVKAASGYTNGDPAWIKVVPEKLKVPGQSIRSAELVLQLPNDPTLRGRRFMFVVQAGLEGRDIPVEIYSRIYVTVAE